MNRDSDGWKDAQGRDIFTPVEKQIRRQIWWSCCIADKSVNCFFLLILRCLTMWDRMSAVWLGRVAYHNYGLCAESIHNRTNRHVQKGRL